MASQLRCTSKSVEWLQCVRRCEGASRCANVYACPMEFGCVESADRCRRIAMVGPLWVGLYTVHAGIYARLTEHLFAKTGDGDRRRG